MYPSSPETPRSQAFRSLPSRVLFTALLLLASAVVSKAQLRIDGSFPFESDPAKKYSLYVPSGYADGTPHPLVVGFHPLNTARWDAQSWCDTLLVFAETQNFLLACPDGGVDGRVDDPIDLAFTHALLDSVESWFSIDTDRVYATGFSWGGRATYRFGLMNPQIFGGFVPIGAAINGTNEVTDIIENADGKPFYIVHGANDIPNTRFFPIRQALIDNGAFVESLLMPGVGHTIDFPNRNEILGVAYQWVDSVNTSFDPAGVDAPHDAFGRDPKSRPLFVSGNPAEVGGEVTVSLVRTFEGPDAAASRSVALFTAGGRQLGSWDRPGLEFQIPMPTVRGTYFLSVSGPEGSAVARLVVR